MSPLKRNLKRTAALIVCGFCLVGLWPAARGDEPATQPGEQVRVLQAENKMLRAALEKQRAEAAALKAQNELLKARLEQMGVTVEDAKAGTAGAAASRPAEPAANAALAKAFLDYARKVADIHAETATGAQKEQARRKAREQILAAFPHGRVMVEYGVEDVKIEKNDTAWLTLGAGQIRPVDETGPGVKVSGVRLQVRMSQANALKVAKGTHCVLSGILSLYEMERPNIFRCPRGTMPFGWLTGVPIPGSGDGHWLGEQVPLAVQEGYVTTLDGKRLDVLRLSASVSNPLVSISAHPALPTPKK